jgi:hypothetical protein
MKKMLIPIVFLCCLISSCDKLEDGDADVILDILPGTWAFSYELQSEEETGLAFEYDHVIFRTDGTVSITYPGGSLDGTYQAGSAVIRIEGQAGGKETRQMLWRIISFSSKTLNADYTFDFNGQSITATVMLEKV